MNCKIIDTATQLFITNGAKTITMDDVCTHCGISKKTLYQKYSNKEQLLSEVMCHISNTIDAKIQEIVVMKLNPIEELLMTQHQILKFFNSDSHAFTYQLNRYYPEICSDFKSQKFKKLNLLLSQNFIRGKELGLYAFPVDECFLVHAFFTSDKAIKNGEFDAVSSDINYLVKQNLIVLIHCISTQLGIQFFNSIKSKYEL